MPLFRFTVYDPDVCEVLQKLKQKRGTFVEVAIREFLKTEKGKNFLQMLLREDINNTIQPKRKRKVDFDEFL